MVIATISGTVTVQPAVWIIKDVAGEFYPCAASVFDKLYEAFA
jgi:hypothetical protein